MIVSMTKDEVEKSLEKRIVYDVLSEIHTISQRWNKGGALIHRVRGAGYMAESGARNIKERKTLINETATFEQMRTASKQMYDDTIGFLYPIITSGIYAP